MRTTRVIGDRAVQVPFSFSRYSFPLDKNISLSFTLEEEQEISLKIYNNMGQVISTLYDNATVRAGYHELQLFGDAFPDEASYARLETRYGVQQSPLVMNARTP